MVCLGFTQDIIDVTMVHRSFSPIAFSNDLLSAVFRYGVIFWYQLFHALSYFQYMCRTGSGG